MIILIVRVQVSLLVNKKTFFTICCRPPFYLRPRGFLTPHSTSLIKVIKLCYLAFVNFFSLVKIKIFIFVVPVVFVVFVVFVRSAGGGRTCL